MMHGADNECDFVSALSRRERGHVAARGILAACVAICALHGVIVSRAHAQEGDGDRWVETGRGSLRDQGDYPWYDSEGDQVRRVDLQADAGTDDGPTTAPAPVLFVDRLLSVFVELIVWVVLLLVFAALVALVIWALFRAEGRQVREQKSRVSTSTGVDRVDGLPIPVAPQGDLLTEARRLYQAGRFDEAIVYLYGYQLVHLDRHQLIRLARGKTNRQYLRELTKHPPVRDRLEATMVAFEDTFFGRHSLPRSRFESVWNLLPEFQSHVEQIAA